MEVGIALETVCFRYTAGTGNYSDKQRIIKSLGKPIDFSIAFGAAGGTKRPWMIPDAVAIGRRAYG